jgi:hypothetical protein
MLFQESVSAETLKIGIPRVFEIKIFLNYLVLNFKDGILKFEPPAFQRYVY